VVGNLPTAFTKSYFARTSIMRAWPHGRIAHAFGPSRCTRATFETFLKTTSGSEWTDSLGAIPVVRAPGVQRIVSVLMIYGVEPETRLAVRFARFGQALSVEL
jgi:hypothetical protein